MVKFVNTSFLRNADHHDQHPQTASLPNLQIEPRHQIPTNREACEIEHGTHTTKQASDRAQPDRRRGEGNGQRQLLLLLKLLLKRCLRRWEQGKDEFPETMAAAARRLANAASTAGIVSSPDARNAFMPRDPTRLIPATRNGRRKGKATARGSSDSTTLRAWNRITAALRSIWLGEDDDEGEGFGNRIRARKTERGAR